MFDPLVAKKCREYIEQRLAESLPLAELRVRKSEVKIRKWPWSRDKIFTGITIHPSREASGEGTCVTDDIGYGVGVTYIRSTGDGIEDVDHVDLFRSHVRGEFLNKKIPVSSIWICTVEFGQWLLPRQYQQHYDSTSLLVRCWSEEHRKA